MKYAVTSPSTFSLAGIIILNTIPSPAAIVPWTWYLECFAKPFSIADNSSGVPWMGDFMLSKKGLVEWSIAFNACLQYLCAVFWVHHKQMTNQVMILQPEDTTQGITGSSEVQNSSCIIGGTKFFPFSFNSWNSGSIILKVLSKDFGDKQYILVYKAGLPTFKAIIFLTTTS